MRKWTPVPFLLAAFMLFGCAAQHLASETTQTAGIWQSHFDGRQWVLANESRQTNSHHTANLRQYVPGGKSLKNTSEILLTIYTPVSPDIPLFPWQIYETWKAERARACPSSEFAVIEQSEDDLVFEWRHGKCDREPPMHYLGRIHYGRTFYAQLLYARQTNRLPPATRDQWMAILQTAQPTPKP